MEDLVTYLGQNLVDHPDDVSVEKRESDRGDTYELTVNENDLGQVIGRQGRTARALRAITRAAAAKQGGRAQVEIME